MRRTPNNKLNNIKQAAKPVIYHRPGRLRTPTKPTPHHTRADREIPQSNRPADRVGRQAKIGVPSGADGRREYEIQLPSRSLEVWAMTTYASRQSGDRTVLGKVGVGAWWA